MSDRGEWYGVVAHVGCGWGGGDGRHAVGDFGWRRGVGSGEGAVYEECGLAVDGGDLHGVSYFLRKPMVLR